MNWRFVSVLVILCALLASCASGGGRSSATRPTAEQEEKYAAAAKTTTIGDVLAGGRLKVVDVQKLGDGKNSLGCTVAVENISASRVKGRCLVRWFEKDGREAVISAPQWQTFDLAPAAGAELSSLAPVPWCTGFAIDVVVAK